MLHAPWFDGEAAAPGGTATGVGRRDITANPARALGTVPADGRLVVRFTGHGAQHVPEHAIGCLSPRKLDAAVDALRARGPLRLATSGHGLTAALPAGSSGSAVLAVPLVRGWSCAVDGGPSRAPGSFGGLLARAARVRGLAAVLCVHPAGPETGAGGERRRPAGAGGGGRRSPPTGGAGTAERVPRRPNRRVPQNHPNLTSATYL